MLLLVLLLLLLLLLPLLRCLGGRIIVAMAPIRLAGRNACFQQHSFLSGESSLTLAWINLQGVTKLLSGKSEDPRSMTYIEVLSRKKIARKSHHCTRSSTQDLNSVHTRRIVKASGFTRGVCKNLGYY